MRKARKRVLSTLLAAVLALGLMPSFAFAGEGGDPTPSDGAPTASGTYFFANGTPITITEEQPTSGTEVTFSGFNATGADAYISWVEDGATKYAKVGSNTSVYGGADGSSNSVSVSNTSVTMTGGTVWNVFGGNLGKQAKDAESCSEVTGDVVMSFSGTAVVPNLLHGGGQYNTCVKGTVYMDFKNATALNDKDGGVWPYINGGVHDNGSSGSRDIANGQMTTNAVVNNVVITATDSSLYLVGGGGSGSTKVLSSSVTLNDCELNSLYLGGINGEVVNSSIVANGCEIEDFSATNRGFVGTGSVDLNDCTITKLNTGAANGCFSSDSGGTDGSGVTGSCVWDLDADTVVADAQLTPLVLKDNGSYTNTYENLTVQKAGEPLELKITDFVADENNYSLTQRAFAVPEGSTLTLKGVEATVIAESTLTNAGAIDMDSASKLAVASDAIFEQMGIVEGRVVNDGGTIKTDYAARVGTTGYSTLQEAINAAGSGATVTLLKNVNENVTIAESDNIILELNGFTLDGGTESGKAALTNNGTVVIQDSSEAGTGTIKRAENGETSAYYVLDNHGTMTINSGTIYNNSGNNINGASLVRNIGSSSSALATLTINGGKLQQDNFIVVKNDDYGKLIVNDGEIVSENNQAIQNWNSAEVKGGLMEGQVITWSYSVVPNNAKMDITGGMIDGPVMAINYYSNDSYGTAPEVNISKGACVTGNLGTYTYNNGVQTPVKDNQAKIAVTGGNFGSPVDEFYLDSSLKAELKSAANREAPYSYFTTMKAALAAAQPGDSVTAVNKEEDVSYFTLTLDYNDGDATADSEYTVESGTEITLPEPTRAGYTFKGWSDGTNTYDAGASYEVKATVTLTAQWSANPTPVPTPEEFDVTVADAQNGTVELSSTTAKEGQKVTVTATPDFGYELAQLTVAGEDGDALELTENADGTYSFTMPAGDVTVHASFADAWENPFTDVSGEDWFYGEVRMANLLGLMKGYDGTTLFGPDDGLMREQAATVMWNLMGDGDVSRPEAPQADVDQSQWYAPYVNWAVDSKVMDGYSEDDFGVGDSLTREQFAAVVAKAVGADVDSADQAALGAFPDADGVSGWARATMAWAVENGVLNGVETEDGSRELQSTRELTRAEMATMMVNAIEVGVLDFGA